LLRLNRSAQAALFFLLAATPLIKNKGAFRAIKKPGIAPGGDSHEKTKSKKGQLQSLVLHKERAHD